MQQSRVIPRPRSFACDLATLCAPTLAGLKPASLFRYQRRGVVEGGTGAMNQTKEEKSSK